MGNDLWVTLRELEGMVRKNDHERNESDLNDDESDSSVSENVRANDL